MMRFIDASAWYLCNESFIALIPGHPELGASDPSPP